MPSWILWLFLAALLTLPVLLRVYVGDEPPRNEITHESDPEDGQEPDGLLAAALGFRS